MDCHCDLRPQWCGFCPSWGEAYVSDDLTWVGTEAVEAPTARAVIFVVAVDPIEDKVH